MTPDITPGTTVRLRKVPRHRIIPRHREDNATAKVLRILQHPKPGVFLDRDLHGTTYWPIADIEPAP